jgi:hypothetical protein
MWSKKIYLLHKIKMTTYIIKTKSRSDSIRRRRKKSSSSRRKSYLKKPSSLSSQIQKSINRINRDIRRKVKRSKSKAKRMRNRLAISATRSRLSKKQSSAHWY